MMERGVVMTVEVIGIEIKAQEKPDICESSWLEDTLTRMTT